MYKNNFMYHSVLTCLIQCVCVIITVYYYHPIKSLNLFNCWFNSKYLFIFYIISSTYYHQKISKKFIPWAGSHEYYVNLNGRVHVMMDTHSMHNRSIACTHCHMHYAYKAMHVYAYAFVSLLQLHTCCSA